MSSLSDLPEFILHLIQSFLNPKNSAQTTLLSKSWRRAWLTRPTLDLDETCFKRNPGNYFFNDDGSRALDPFRVFVEESLQRYEESDLRLDAFRLHLWSGWCNPWISKALKLGVTDITLRFKYQTSIEDPIDEVENLVKLCLNNTRIHQRKVIEPSGLRSLTLSDTTMSSDSFFNVVSGCPLIEDLSLSNVQFSDHGRIRFSDDQQVTMVRLCNLRSLVMSHLDCRFHAMLGDLSPMFPTLKTLTLIFSAKDLVSTKASTMVIITSHSVEVLRFTVDGGRNYDHRHKEKNTKRIELDVPKIRNFIFTFKGYNLPEMCFTPTMEGRCDSHLSIMRYHELSTTWFRQLSKFLTCLRGSKIHLRLLEYSLNDRFDYRYYEARALLESLRLRPCVLEDVTIDAMNLRTRNFHVLLDGLFWICRPKMIVQYVTEDDYEGVNGRNNELLQFMGGLGDLDEVQRMDDSTKRVGFQLRWKRKRKR